MNMIEIPKRYDGTNTLISTGTHIPLLAACIAHTSLEKGPVVELGAGHYSTPLLHYLCAAMGGRQLLTCDSDPDWIAKFADLARPWHSFQLIEDWGTCDLFNRNWSVAFVDHGDRPGRGESVACLADRAGLVVAHDTEPARKYYGYDAAFAKFKYRFDFDRYAAHATVVSNTDDLLWLNG